MEPIAPSSRRGRKQYILVATDYATKWTETTTTRINDAHIVARFLYENIFFSFQVAQENLLANVAHISLTKL